MAVGVSGSFELVATTPSSAAGGLKYRLNYREDYDIAGNWSTLTITSIEVYVPSGYYYGSTWYTDGIVSINGVDTKTFNSVSGGSSVYVSSNNTWFTVSNTSFTSARIPHDTDGKKTITLEVKQRGLSTFAFSGGSYSGWGANGSKSITLTTIPRASDFTIPSSVTMGSSASFSISPASSSFRHTLTYKVGSKSDTIGTSIEQSKTWSVPDLCSYIANGQTSATITYTLITYNNGTEVGRKSKDGMITMPAKSTASVPSFTMGTKGRITFSKNLSSYAITVSYSFGTASNTIVSKTGDGYVDFTPPTSLGNQIPNAMSGKGTITVSTYANSSSGTATTLVGSNTYDFNCSVPSSAKPSASWVSAGITNDNATIRGWGVAVKGFTKYSWEVSASGIYGSTIKSFAFSFGSLKSSSGKSSTTVFNAAGTFTPTMVVTDTRGQQTTITASNVTVYDYASPTIVSSNAYRSDDIGAPQDEGTYITMWLNGVTYYSCGGHNTVTIQRRTKSTTGSWTSWIDIPNNTPTIVYGFAIDVSYNVEMRVIDSIGGSSGQRSVTITIPTASVALHFRDGGKGAAFFGYSQYGQEDNVLEVFGKLFAHGEANTLKQTNDINHSLEMYTGSTSGETVGFRDRIAGEWFAYLNSNSGTREMYMPHPLRLQGHSSAVGSIEYCSGTKTVSVPNDSWTAGASVQLTAGSWIIFASADFTQNSVGDRYLQINASASSNSGLTNVSSVKADSNGYTRMQFSMPISIESTTTYYALVSQTAGGTISTDTYIKAMRIA